MMGAETFRAKFDHGFGRPQAYDNSWISGVEELGSATETTDAPDAFITGGDNEFDTSEQDNAAKDVMHLLAKLTDDTDTDAAAPSGATATIGLWVQPANYNGWYMVEEYTMNNDVGQMWTRRHNIPGTYRVSVEDITDGARVEVKYAVTA